MACTACNGTGLVTSAEPWFGVRDVCGCVLEDTCPRCDGGLMAGLPICNEGCGWELGKTGETPEAVALETARLASEDEAEGAASRLWLEWGQPD